MICLLVEALIKITEDFGKPHAVIHNFINDGQIITQTNKPSFLNPNSPSHLFRKPGLNITKYDKIMKKAGVISNKKR